MDYEGLIVLLLFAVPFFAYWTPTVFAFARGHHNRWPILVFNLFFGWTVIGWVIALMFALSNPPTLRVVGPDSR